MTTHRRPCGCRSGAGYCSLCVHLEADQWDRSAPSDRDARFFAVPSAVAAAPAFKFQRGPRITTGED